MSRWNGGRQSQRELEDLDINRRVREQQAKRACASCGDPMESVDAAKDAAGPAGLKGPVWVTDLEARHKMACEDVESLGKKCDALEKQLTEAQARIAELGESAKLYARKSDNTWACYERNGRELETALDAEREKVRVLVEAARTACDSTASILNSALAAAKEGASQ